MKLLSFVLLSVSVFFVKPLSAAPLEIRVGVEVTVGESPHVRLTWDQQPGTEENMRITVYRRALGVKSGEWYGQTTLPYTQLTLFEEIAVLPPSVLEFTDDSVVSGNQYEYRIHRPAISGTSTKEAATYVAVSVETPLEDTPGDMLLVIDETLVEEMETELRLLEMDLVGEGWGVTRLLTPPHGLGDPVELRAAIQAACLANEEIKGLYLFGKVPVARSGFSAPDGHEAIAHETDLFYADLEGLWTDTSNWSPTTGGEEGSNVAGDGKFDQRLIPRAVDLMVGRVDLSRLTAVRKNELELLRDYVHKTHAWRNGDRNVPYRALLNNSHLFQDHTWAKTIFGSGNLTFAPFQSTLNTEPHVWAMDFGDWNGASGTYYGAVDNRALFFLNFGSHKQKWRRANNPMRVLLAQPDWGLTAGWGARPAWHMHQMAAGWPVGRSHKRTVNNLYNGGEFHPRGNYSHLDSQVHINLMGDPTLRLHVAPPPKGPEANRSGETVTLTWEAPDGNAQRGYHVYRSGTATSSYERLTETPLAVGAILFVDPAAPVTGNVYYQIRAVHRNETLSGVYDLASRGAMVWLAEGANHYRPPVASPPPEHVATPGVPLRLTVPGTESDGIRAVILAHPENGLIRWQNGHPVYVSKPGFIGTETLSYRLFDGVGLSETAVLTVTVSGEADGALLGWSFPNLQDGLQGTASTLNGTGVQPSIITFGPNVLRSATGTLQSNAMLTSTVNTVDRDEDGWLGWTVTPQPGYTLNLDTLFFFAASGSLDADSNRLRPFGMELHASVDQFATSVVVPLDGQVDPRGLHAAAAGGRLFAADLAGLGFNALDQELAFRLYVWNTANFALGKSGYNSGQNTMDLTVTGSRTIKAPVANAGADQVRSWGYYAVQLDAMGSVARESTYLWTQVSGPEVSLSYADSPSPTFSAQTPGLYEFRVTVTNASGQDSDTVFIELTPDNSPPLLTAGNDPVAVLGATVYLHAEAFDPEGDPITFQWSQLEGPDVDLMNAESLTPSFDADEAGFYRFLVTASSNGQSATNTVELNITSGDLLVHYPFDEGGGGVVLDASAHPVVRNITTANGTMNWAAEGRFGSAYGTPALDSGTFPGLSIPESGSLPLNARGDEYSLSLWVRTTSDNTYNGYIDKQNTSGIQLRFWGNNNRLILYNGGTRADFDTSSTGSRITNGEWHHLVLVNLLVGDIWKTQFYYDAALVLTFDSGALGTLDTVSLKLGEGNRGPKQLDDFRLYTRALTEAEVSAMYEGHPVAYNSGEGAAAMHTVSFLAAGNTGARLEGSAYQGVSHGSNSLPVTAVPDSGSLFAGWWIDDTLVSTSAEMFLEGVTESMTITARFVPQGPAWVEAFYADSGADVEWGDTEALFRVPLADGNSDGIPNLLHLLHGASPLVEGRDHLPRLLSTPQGMALRFQVTEDPLVHYDVYRTYELDEWPILPLWTGGVEHAVDGVILYHDAVPGPVPPQRFYRLEYRYEDVSE